MDGAQIQRKICPAVDRVRAGVSGVMEKFFLQWTRELGNEDPRQQVVSLGEVEGAFQAEGTVWAKAQSCPTVQWVHSSVCAGSAQRGGRGEERLEERGDRGPLEGSESRARRISFMQRAGGHREWGEAKKDTSHKTTTSAKNTLQSSYYRQCKVGFRVVEIGKSQPLPTRFLSTQQIQQNPINTINKIVKWFLQMLYFAVSGA